MEYWPSLVARNDLPVHVAHEPTNCIDALRWRLTTRDHGAIAIAENAVDRVYPCARGAVAKGVGARGVGRHHSAERTKIPAGGIDGKAQPLSSPSNIERRPQTARLRPYGAVPLVDPAEMIDAREIDYDSSANRSARHAAPRSAWNETRPRLARPFNQDNHVLCINRDSDGRWNRPTDSCRLGINRASKRVFAKISAEVWQAHEPEVAGRLRIIAGEARSHNPRLLTRGGVEE